MRSARLIYIPENDRSFPATGPERPLYAFSVAGTSIGAYCMNKLRLAGFNAVFDPEEGFVGVGEEMEISMQDFSVEIAMALAACERKHIEFRNTEGRLLGRKGNSKEGCSVEIVEGLEVERFIYPWDLLDWQERVMKEMKGTEDPSCISPGVHVSGVLHLGDGSVLLPGVVTEGSIWVGKGCKIGPNCYLRGLVSIGDGSVVGQGVELKNCIVGRKTFISHLSYAGDSIIGDDVNFGAGAVCSNFRHDGGEHRMSVGGELLKTGRTKLGAVIGDHVRLGVHSVVLPGRVMPPGTWTMPGEVFSK